MFAELESLRGASTDEALERRKALAEQVTIELVRHSVAEEVLVYPEVEDKVSREEACAVSGHRNGDLFTHLLAFSPGFAAPAVQVSRPRILVTHSVHDHVLPIARCSRRLMPALRDAGYEVDYTEFDGGHTVPPPLVARAAARVAG